MSDAIEMTLTIEFLSDWRVGNGASGILADRAVQRDPRDLPRVPGETIVGIWRDACEALATGLDGGATHGHWQELVDLLFGDQPARRTSDRPPRAALLDVRHAALPRALREVLGHPDRAPLREALSHVRAATSIDQHGAAKPDHLRFEEAARRGMVLHAPVTLRARAHDRDSESPFVGADRLLALLAGGAAHVDRLGAGRRRGLGRCRWSLPLDPQEVLDALAGSERQLRLPASGRVEHASPAEEAAGDLHLRIEAESDLVVGERVLGNSVRSRSLVPGTMLLAHVAAAVDAACGRGAAARAIETAQLTMTDATPQLGGAPGRPVPNTLAAYRDEPSNGDIHVVNAWVGDRDPARQTKALRSGFCGAAQADAPIAYQRPGRTVRVHGVINDELQRPDEHGIYTYEALPERSVLACEVRFDGDLATALARPGARELLTRALSGSIRIGRSRHAGYGAARVSVSPAAAAAPRRAPIADNPSALTIWLTSDLLWEDESLEQATGPAAVRDAVACALAAVGYREQLQIGRHATRVARREGWLAAWGLPRPSCIGVAAGSVLELTPSGARPSEQQLRALERSGVGLRRAEGFGQLRIDDPLATRPSLLLRTPPPAAAAEEMRLLDRPDPLAQSVQLAAWRREIQRLAVLISEQPAQRRAVLSLKDSHALKPSQLGALRQLARALPEDEQAGLRWLRAMRTPEGEIKDRARSWFDAWRDDGTTIGQLLSPGPHVWRVLEELPGGESSLRDPLRLTICDSPQEMHSRLWGYATAALIDVCARAEAQEVRS